MSGFCGLAAKNITGNSIFNFLFCQGIATLFSALSPKKVSFCYGIYNPKEGSVVAARKSGSVA